MSKWTKITKCVLLAAALWNPASRAAIIIDNGPVDPSRPTWNDIDPHFTIYDDFRLTHATSITGINYHIFTKSIGLYIQTFASIFDGITPGASAVFPEFAAVGDLTPNGLTTSNPVVPNGFDVSITGLDINLGPGTYFLGIRTDTSSGHSASIGSGPGGPDTLGTGLFQTYGTNPADYTQNRVNDHFAFQLIGVKQVPEPPILALFGLGLAGILLARRRKIPS